MKTTRFYDHRHRPRGVDPDDLALDLALRAAVRGVIRETYPDAPKPAGAGWLIAAAPLPCPKCFAETLLLVSVPGMQPTFGYCTTCTMTGEVLDLSP